MRPLVYCSLVLAFASVASCSRPPSVERGPSRLDVGLDRLDGVGGTEARARLDDLWRAVNARDLHAILDAYDPDSSAQRDARTRFDGLLALDSLRCDGRIAGIASHGDTVEAIAFENASWRDNQRPQASAAWRTYKLRRISDRFKIVSDSQRDYALAHFTDLSVDLQPDSGTVRGTAHIDLGITDPGEDNLLLQLNRGLEVGGIAGRDGKAVPFSRRADVITVSLPKPCRTGDSLRLTIEFAGAFFNESKEQGYSQVAIAPAGSFASWVTSWYPHLLDRGSKSLGRITYTVPSGITVASSGKPIESTEVSGRSRQVYDVRQPLDFSFAAATYFHKTREVAGTRLGVYFLRGGDAKAELYIDAAAKVLAFEKDLYGFYPFDGYSIVEVPSEEVGTLGGSSEQGMNLFPVGGLPDDRFPLPLLAHEMGHSWWGNLVAGDGAVIDEALAQTTAVLAVEGIEGTRAMRRFLRYGKPDYAQSAHLYFTSYAGVAGADVPLAGPASDAAGSSALHGLSDVKGHFVYEMLRETIGDEAFKAGLRTAVTRYARRALHLADLRRIWEGTSGRDLAWFFTEWFERSGAPEFRMTYAITPAAGGFDVAGRITQTGEPYSIAAEIVCAEKGRPLSVETIAVSGSETPFRFHLDRKPEVILFDPDYKIFRWTDSYRNLLLFTRETALRENGMETPAIAELKGYLAKAPDDMTAMCDLGIAYEEQKRLDLAESQFRTVMDRAEIYDSDDPATALSELHLGHIADLRHRREEAKEWYSKALASSDAAAVREDADTCLLSPYKSKPRIHADPAIVARCPGTYAIDGGITVVIAADSIGILTVRLLGRPAVPLAPTGGSRFRLLGSTPGTFEFAGVGKGGFSDLAVHAFGREFHLQRQGGQGQNVQK